MQKNPKSKRNIKIGIILVFLFVFIYLIVNLDKLSYENIVNIFLNNQDDQLLEILFVLIATFLIIFFVPMYLFSAAAAFLFGLQGIFWVITAGVLSAIISFSIARIFRADFSRIVEKVYYKQERELTLEEIYLKINEYGFGYVFFLRTIPVVPFSIGNYIFGVSFISFKYFIFSTLLAVTMGQSINIYFFAKALEIGEHPLDTLIAIIIKVVYYLLILLWSRMNKYNAENDAENS